MTSVVHVVVTHNRAGVERYVCDTARELARRGWQATVIGGSPLLMPRSFASDVRWLPGSTLSEALRSLLSLGRQDICHVHMTAAEALGVIAKPVHRAVVVSTRHFAARRGSTAFGRALAPLIARGVSRELAISCFVASRLERPPHAVLRNGVPPSPCVWRPSSRVVLVLQRLESEKDTFTALRAWRSSRLWEEGWSMRIVGDGSQRAALEQWTDDNNVPEVRFVGWVADVQPEFARTGLLLATAPLEPFGLGVLEAMAAGVPVVACGAGGHLETIGRLAEALLFPPGDAEAAAAALRSLLPESGREAASDAARRLVEAEFSVRCHVDRLLGEYEFVLARARRRLRHGSNDRRRDSGRR
jgi:glycosyltransferase involved in cell wall biosynthesis